MLRNITILLISAAIVSSNLYLFRHKTIQNRRSRYVTATLFLMWFFTIFLPNIPTVLSPLTPEIKGTVVDAETKRPIAGCNIKAYWVKERVGLVAANWKNYHEFHIKSDTNGNFRIPAYVKILRVAIIPFSLESHYGGINLLSYSHRFRYSLDNISPQQDTFSKITVMMTRSSTTSVLNDLYELSHLLQEESIPRGISSEDTRYLLEDYSWYYKNIERIHDQVRGLSLKRMLIIFASRFYELGDHKKAIEVYRRLKQEYPETSVFADNAILEIEPHR